VATSPLNSLQTGQWCKLICGASYQHIPSIRSLAVVYTLAGVDCIDVAADPAIIATVREGINVAQELGAKTTPWLMVSLNDGEDPHFRKATFDIKRCPIDCDRPCEKICPAAAIDLTGVLTARCYGCGRCLSICPLGLIEEAAYVYQPETVVPLVMAAGIDAVEIHTQVGRLEPFRKLWAALEPVSAGLNLIAVSCPDGEGMIDYLWALQDLMQDYGGARIWQTDGRPMSGDIGGGATRACLNLGEKVLKAGLPGFVQLAGGTNDSTVQKARDRGLFQTPALTPVHTPGLAGIAYGSYARSQLQPWLSQLEWADGSTRAIETDPELLWACVAEAAKLVSPLKISSL
jgi:Fe-S-cluster-containing hydrogenase component 2